MRHVNQVRVITVVCQRLLGFSMVSNSKVCYMEFSLVFFLSAWMSIHALNSLE